MPGCVHYVYLQGSEDLIRRLADRKGYFMNPSLLHSQFEILEPPEDVIQVDVSPAPQVIVADIRQKIGI